MSQKIAKTLLAACAMVALTLGSQAYGADKVKIGFLLKTMQEERYQHDKADFTAKAQALGADVVFDSANNDEQAQLAKVRKHAGQGLQSHRAATGEYRNGWQNGCGGEQRGGESRWLRLDAGEWPSRPDGHAG